MTMIVIRPKVFQFIASSPPVLGRQTTTSMRRATAARISPKCSTLNPMSTTRRGGCRLYSHSLKVLSSSAPATFDDAQDKLRKILEDYQAANYRQTIPSRFVKDICRGADQNHDGFIEREEIHKFFVNIGIDTNALTDEEIDVIFNSVPLEAPVSVDHMVEYLTKLLHVELP